MADIDIKQKVASWDIPDSDLVRVTPNRYGDDQSGTVYVTMGMLRKWLLDEPTSLPAKPPEVSPKWAWHIHCHEQRIKDLEDAIRRYVAAKLEPDIQWSLELRQLKEATRFLRRVYGLDLRR